jgi:hypothetical protein
MFAIENKANNIRFKFGRCLEDCNLKEPKQLNFFGFRNLLLAWDPFIIRDLLNIKRRVNLAPKKYFFLSY